MKKQTVWIFAIAWLSILIMALSCDSCSTTQVVPTPSTNDYQLACQNLESLKCPIGSDPLCAATLQEEDTGHLTNIDVSCLKVATTQAAAVACGGVSCQ
jgi:hypothetical protein